MGSRRTVLASALAALAVAALVAGGIVYAHRLTGRHPVAAAAPPVVPAATPARTTAPATTRAALPLPSTPSPVPSPARSRRPAGPVHETVAAAAPSGFVYRGHGYSVRASVCGMDYVRPLDPPGEQHHTVCWVQQDFGVAPGSAARGTTYVLGHSWAEDPAEVLNPVSARAMKQVLARAGTARATSRLDGTVIHPVTVLDGDTMTLRTAAGTLRYTVRSAYAVDKDRAGYISSLMDERVRDRVVLITCGERGAVDYDYNIIVYAFLTSSRAAASAPARQHSGA